MTLKSIFFILLFLNFCALGFSQEKGTKKDSTTIYEKIEDYSKKRNFTKFLHKLIFKSTQKKPPKKFNQTTKQDLSAYHGKIIRHIAIESHDPFGFSFTDSTESANSWVEKTGNTIHIKSKRFTIKNALLIKENQPLDLLALRESERLLRSQNYIRKAQIKVENVIGSRDSVDIFIEILDSWSLIPKVNVSTNVNTFRLRDKNFLGFGHQFDTSITNQLDDGTSGYSFRYSIPNFKNTYINTSVGYTIDLNGFYRKYFSANRPFYSPLTKWAAGITIDERFRKVLLSNETLGLSEQRFNYLSQDVWAGHSLQLFEGNSEKERTTNLISAVRLLHLDYKEAPSIAYDSIHFFSNETFYLGSFGIASRQYIQDSYLFQDGITEDVPVGTIYAITGGIQHKNRRDRPYLGGKISHGNYFKWGFLSTNFEFGTFINNGKTEQTTYAFQANYFTNLISLGEKWKMRQFVKPQFLIGTHRLNSVGDRLTIDESNPFQGVYGNDEQRKNSASIPGFNGNILGTKKGVLSLQTQFYSPWEVWGFRLNPYINITTGLLGDASTQLFKSKLYSAFGIGFIVRNDYLVFSSFQFSLAYYPSIPGNGDHIFDTNSFETEDFGFQDFQLGKPTPVWYN